MTWWSFCKYDKYVLLQFIPSVCQVIMISTLQRHFFLYQANRWIISQYPRKESGLLFYRRNSLFHSFYYWSKKLYASFGKFISSAVCQLQILASIVNKIVSTHKGFLKFQFLNGIRTDDRSETVSKQINFKKKMS